MAICEPQIPLSFMYIYIRGSFVIFNSMFFLLVDYYSSIKQESKQDRSTRFLRYEECWNDLHAQIMVNQDLSLTIFNMIMLSKMLYYVPRVPSCPKCLTCLTCLRALRFHVHYKPACLCAFASYVPFLFYVPYVLSFFTCLAYIFFTCFTGLQFLRVLRAFSFYMLYYVPKFFYVPSFFSILFTCFCFSYMPSYFL